MKRKFYLKQVRKSKSALFIFFLLIIFACSQKKINEETAIKVYVENIIVEEKYSSAPDSIKYYKNKVFAKYNTTEEGFREFLLSLDNNTERWNNFFRKADTYLIELKTNRVID